MKKQLPVLAVLSIVAFLLLAAPLVASSFGPNGSNVPSVRNSDPGPSAGLGRGASSPAQDADPSAPGIGPQGDEAGLVGSLPAGALPAGEVNDPLAAGLMP